jgi:general secretion pathway protein G
MPQRSKSSQAGVTLIEMLVVVSIIGLFTTVAAMRFLPRAEAAKVVAARTQIATFSNALALYKLDNGSYPLQAQGLSSLRIKPEGADSWAGPYLEKDIPADPWGHPYSYKFPGDHGEEPDIVSYGADGQAGGSGTGEDIVNWRSK